MSETNPSFPPPGLSTLFFDEVMLANLDKHAWVVRGTFGRYDQALKSGTDDDLRLTPVQNFVMSALLFMRLAAFTEQAAQKFLFEPDLRDAYIAAREEFGLKELR